VSGVSRPSGRTAGTAPAAAVCGPGRTPPPVLCPARDLSATRDLPPSRSRGLSLALFLAVLATAAAGAAACRGGGGSAGGGKRGPAELAARAGELFARFSRGLSPGCALAVIQDGQVVLARGYGFADLSRRAAITPRTVFDVASASKQFTAACVLLLAQRGRLRLDDDVRKYVPELPRFRAPDGTPAEMASRIAGAAAGADGAASAAGLSANSAPPPAGDARAGVTITLDQLLHHTSGLPSYIDLLVRSGRRYEEVTGDDEALAALAGVRQTLFRPGTVFRYSDTGYFLLSLVIKRVTGQSLRQFAADNLFTPLGMTDTRILDDPAQRVPRRAVAYTRAPGGGYQPEQANWEQTGDGGVNTTVLDLAKWDANFDSGAVGGKALVAAMTTPGTDAAGRPLPYGGGLFLDRFHGLRRVRHPGSWRGWCAELMRLPERHLSVITLCNRDDADPTGLAEGMAEAALAARR
jgi:CubicO group peptidase (beta-lactamase class C family)